MAFSLVLNGEKELVAWLNNMQEALRKDVNLEIQASCLDIEREAKQAVPVDTGILKNSIKAEKIDNGGEVNAYADYAAYVEFGTGSGLKVPPIAIDYALTFRRFKGVGKRRNMPARPYLFPAFFRNKIKLIERIKKIIIAKK